jgi:hypothetical protein
MLGCPVEYLGFQVLLDPFEEDFDLPTVTIQLRHLRNRQAQAVSLKDIVFPGFLVPVINPVQSSKISYNGPQFFGHSTEIIMRLNTENGFASV